MADGKVRIQVEDNARQSARDFARLDRELKDVSKSAGQADKNFILLRNTVSALAAGAIAVQFARTTSSIIAAGSAAEETANKFGTAFRGIEKQATAAAEALADSYNLSAQESQRLLADTGDLLKGFGFTSEAALGLSNNIQQLAADLVSYNDFQGGTAEASRILTKALLGETDALVSLGTKLNVSDLEAFAEAQGQVFKELNRSERALITYNAILAQNQDAIGDVERSQGSYAQQLREFQAAVADLQAQLGTGLLPVATKTLEVLTEIVEAVNDLFSTNAIERQQRLLAEGNRNLEKQLFLRKEIRRIEGAIGRVESDSFKRGLFDPSRETQLKVLNGRLDSLNEKLRVTKEENAAIGEQLEQFRIPEVSSGGGTSSAVDVITTSAKTAKDAIDGLAIAVKELSLEERLTETISTTNDIALDAYSNLADGLAGILVSPFEEGESAAERFSKLALSVIQGIAQEIIRNQLVGLFANIAGGAAGGQGASFVGPPVASAKGNVFQGGNLKAFANGGVVSSPTFFPMANGGTGLMGEAGAEAIMPLRRGKGGRLGVEAGDISPTVNVINNTSAQIETVSRPNNEVDIIVNQVNSVLASQRSDGAFSAALNRQQTSGVQGF